MKNIIILISLFIIANFAAVSQGTSINETGDQPHQSAIFEVTSADKGVLIPRINYDELPDNPPNGLLFYLYNDGYNQGNGFYHHTTANIWHGIDKWNVVGNDLIYSKGGVAINIATYIDDLEAGLAVNAGILYDGNYKSETPGLVYYDEVSSEFKYFDNNANKKVLGVDDISYVHNPNGWYNNTMNSTVNTQLASVIRGKTLIGFDANSTYDFGENLLVLIENNTRITFKDASTAPGEPYYDWNLMANSTSNGGKNLFAIIDSTDTRFPFQVEASSEPYGFYLKENYAGVGTNMPVKHLHFKSDTELTMRFEQDSSQSNPIYIWDIAFNEAGVYFYDITGGTTPLFIDVSAPDNSIVISGDGVGLGISPQRSFHVNGAMKIVPQAAAPSSPQKGDIYFDSNDNKLKCYDGSQWQNLY